MRKEKKQISESVIAKFRTATTQDEFLSLTVGIYPSQYLESGDIYTGPFDRKEKRSGFGLVCFADGSWYLGDWLADMAHGRGKHLTADGTISDG